MPSVTERLGYTVDEAGLIHYDKRASTWEAADELAGHRVDRRKNWCIIQGQLCESATWTDRCSGCEGTGCRECGYRGKYRRAAWVPYQQSPTN